MRKVLVKSMGLALVIALILGLSTLAMGAGEKYGDTFVFGMGSDPQVINSAITNSLPDLLVAHSVYSMLAVLDQNLEPQPDLAEKWDISEDGLVYTFKLRSGVKWHDGEPFTSADVKFTVDEILTKFHPRAGNYTEVLESVETPDDYTVIFKLKKPYGPFFNAVCYDMAISPKHLYENTDILNNPCNKKPVGTGPFMFEEWVHGSHITLTRNPNYFREGMPYLDRLVFKIIPDASSRILALETGDIDYLSYLFLPSSAVADFKKNPDFTIVEKGFESLGTTLTLVLNFETPALQDVRVRKAIAMAIDKEYIVKHADFGLGKPAMGPIPSASPAFDADAVTIYPYDLEAAAALLDEAGFTPGPDGTRMTIRLTADTGVELNRKGGEIVKANLEKVGIKVDYVPMERGTMLDKVYVQRDFDMLIHGFSVGTDPAINTARFYVSSNIRPVAFTNGSAYKNPVVDELFLKAESSYDWEERRPYYSELQSILTEELPVVSLVEIGLVGVHSARFHNLHSWADCAYLVTWDYWSDEGTSSQPGGMEQQDEGFPTAGYVAIIAAVVIALALIIWQVVKRKNVHD